MKLQYAIWANISEAWNVALRINSIFEDQSRIFFHESDPWNPRNSSPININAIWAKNKDLKASPMDLNESEQKHGFKSFADGFKCNLCKTTD